MGKHTAFRFSLGQAVVIAVSGECGRVIAQAEFLDQENSYLLRYKDAKNRAVETWWTESALEYTV